MKGIFQKLPSLASDYSGACGVLFEMGGLTVLCDASGCSGSFLILDDPRWYTGPQRFYSAQLRERDVVLGMDQKLVRKITQTHEAVGGDFLAVVGTPVPSIVGTDFDGICRELEKRVGVPAIGIDTTGMETYERGQTKTYMKLLERFADDGADGIADVHVIGATPLDMWDINQTDDLIALLKSCGAERPAVWGINSSVAEIAGISHSKLNVAVSVSALPVVRKLEQNYGTPYVIGYPVGEKATREWKVRISAALKGERPAAVTDEPGAKRIRALIVGEQVASESLRGLFLQEFGFEQVDVASYFTMDAELMREGDAKLVEEDDLPDLLAARERYDVILADPLLLRLLPYQPKMVVPLPHTAVSSRAFWNQSPNCLGDKGSLYFAQALRSLLDEQTQSE